jgi:hypothetical protein
MKNILAGHNGGTVLASLNEPSLQAVIPFGAWFSFSCVGFRSALQGILPNTYQSKWTDIYILKKKKVSEESSAII